jgi:hypothetical protein
VRSRAELYAVGLLALALACGDAERSSAQPPRSAADRSNAPADQSGRAHDESHASTPLEEAPTADEIIEALAKVEADPNLATVRMMRTLRWKSRTQERSGPPGWLLWVAGLFEWFAETGRLLVWVAVLLLAGLLGVYVVRLVRRRRPRGAGEQFVAPSHVRDLDIRPESLPDDVGAAARALWDRGERRAALALLYRGLLSRLAHTHGVPIRDSSTEGDCLDLAARRLSLERMGYTARLVGVWQVAVYGGESPDTAEVYSLCEEFGRTLAVQPASSLDADSAPERVP